MGDPGLLQETPDIPPLLPEGGTDGEQACAAEAAGAGLNTVTDLALDDCLPERPFRAVAGGFDSGFLQEGL